MKNCGPKGCGSYIQTADREVPACLCALTASICVADEDQISYGRSFSLARKEFTGAGSQVVLKANLVASHIDPTLVIGLGYLKSIPRSIMGIFITSRVSTEKHNMDDKLLINRLTFRCGRRHVAFTAGSVGDNRSSSASHYSFFSPLAHLDYRSLLGILVSGTIVCAGRVATMTVN